MGKYKYAREYEINASLKMLWPYLSTASGLQDWFADRVTTIGDKMVDFVWDNENHPAKIISKRTNSHIKYVFHPRKDADNDDQAYIEFKVDHNDLTQTSFLKVVDYSDMESDADLDNLWGHLVGTLKEVLGASA